jgi:hypothetical protein
MEMGVSGLASLIISNLYISNFITYYEVTKHSGQGVLKAMLMTL